MLPYMYIFVCFFTIPVVQLRWTTDVSLENFPQYVADMHRTQGFEKQFRVS